MHLDMSAFFYLVAAAVASSGIGHGIALWHVPLSTTFTVSGPAHLLPNDGFPEDADGSCKLFPIVIQGCQPGPTVMVVAGLHGNEPAGALAAEKIAQWSILRGKLVVLPRANPPALAAQQRGIPDAPTNERDLNRNFPLDKGRCLPRGPLAQALWEMVESNRPDWLVDLHESVGYRRVEPHRVGNTVIICPDRETESAAQALLTEINATIASESQQFVLLQWTAKGSLTRAAATVHGAHCMILETTRLGPLEKRVEQHCLLVRVMLQHLGMLPDEALPSEGCPSCP